MDEQKKQKQEEQKRIREAIDQAWALTEDDLEWKPYYPNNILECGQQGWYCIVQDKGKDYALRYTILFQYHEDEELMTHPEQGVELYVLCHRTISDLDGPLTYPEPDSKGIHPLDDHYHINDHGSFWHAYPTLEQAKKKVLWSLRMHGYVLSHLLEDDDEDEDGEEP